ncbi:MAG: hypothetical protein V1495_10840 [Pseudomonadota bacterium]
MTVGKILQRLFLSLALPCVVVSLALPSVGWAQSAQRDPWTRPSVDPWGKPWGETEPRPHSDIAPEFLTRAFGNNPVYLAEALPAAIRYFDSRYRSGMTAAERMVLLNESADKGFETIREWMAHIPEDPAATSPEARVSAIARILTLLEVDPVARRMLGPKKVKKIVERVAVKFKGPEDSTELGKWLSTLQTLDEILRKRVRFEHSNEKLKEKVDQETGKALKKIREQETGKTAQLLVFLMVISGAAVAQQEIHYKRIRGEKVDASELAEICWMVAGQVLDGGSTWFGIGGGTLFGKLFGKPLEYLRVLMSNGAARGIFRNLLASGIQSIIIFVGWDLGIELWEEARGMLTDLEDYKISEGMWTGAIATAGSLFVKHPPPYVQRKRRVFLQILSNIGVILSNDEGRRNQWIYNTWRLKTATGEFVTMVAAMTTAGYLGGMIGSNIYPGWGTAIGIGFSMAGAMAAINLPQQAKDLVTLGIKKARLIWDETALSFNEDDLDHDTDLHSPDRKRRPLREQLDRRRETRNDILTIYLEAYYLLKVRILNAEQENAVIQETLKNWDKQEIKEWYQLLGDEFVERLEPQRLLPMLFPQLHGKGRLAALVVENYLMIDQCKKALEWLDGKLIDFYPNEERILKKFLYRTEGIRNPNVNKPVLEAELADIQIMEQWMHAWSLGFHPSDEEFSQYPEYLIDPETYKKKRYDLSIQSLETSNFRAFNEGEVVTRWKEALLKARMIETLEQRMRP